MDIDKPQLKFIGIFVAAVLAFVAYQKLSSKSYAPIEFLGETYKHIEDVSPNDYVHTYMFSLGGAPEGKFDRWIQITHLSPEVTLEQRETVDQQIKSSMNVAALPGSDDRLFGFLGDVAVHVLMLDSTYVLYLQEVQAADREKVRNESARVFEELGRIPAIDD